MDKETPRSHSAHSSLSHGAESNGTIQIEPSTTDQALPAEVGRSIMPPSPTLPAQESPRYDPTPRINGLPRLPDGIGNGIRPWTSSTPSFPQQRTNYQLSSSASSRPDVPKITQPYSLFPREREETPERGRNNELSANPHIPSSRGYRAGAYEIVPRTDSLHPALPRNARDLGQRTVWKENDAHHTKTASECAPSVAKSTYTWTSTASATRSAQCTNGEFPSCGTTEKIGESVSAGSEGEAETFASDLAKRGSYYDRIPSQHDSYGDESGIPLVRDVLEPRNTQTEAHPESKQPKNTPKLQA